MPLAERDQHEAAIVLFSGGQDSATCLAWALARFNRVETLGFHYGQRHAVELECRAALREGMAASNPLWRERLGPDHTLPLDALHMVSETALTREAEITITESGLPNTFVPGRNLLFLTFAAALAARRTIRHIITGVCETDYSGYPDCRDDTIKSLQVSLNLGMERRYVIHTPLMWLSKAETWMLAEELGGQDLVSLINRESHTCYTGQRETLHPWGYGCGTCPACHLRQTGWEAIRPGKPNMPELVFTRRFSMGHRLIHGASESCALPHGHNELVTVRLNATTPARLDGLGNMAISFQQAKGTWHRFVDEKLDHALQLAQDDPLLDWFLVHEPARARRIVVTPGDPTTELMACLLMAKINAFLKHEGGVLHCTELSLQETPTNTVCFSGAPEDFIPQTDFSRTPWWQRADMSISDLT